MEIRILKVATHWLHGSDTERANVYPSPPIASGDFDSKPVTNTIGESGLNAFSF